MPRERTVRLRSLDRVVKRESKEKVEDRAVWRSPERVRKREGAEVGVVGPGGEDGGELQEALEMEEEGLGLGGGELLGSGGCEQQAEDDED